MKIFNWVHRRFLPKDGLDQNVKKDEHSLTNDHADTEALLKNVVPADMLHFHGWGGAGILSIGTFGLKDDFSITEHKKDYFSLIGKEQDMESEDEQSNDDDDDGDDGRNDDSNSDKEDYEEEWNPLVYDKSGAPRPNAIVMNVIDTKLLSPNNLLLDLQDYSYSRNNYHRHKNNDNKKERITLADLFSADSDDEHYGATKKPNYGKTQCSKKPAPDCGAAKNATSFAAKKFIPRVKEDSRPIQKLHGLMKKMLKRKIHPDVVEGKIKPCTTGNGNPSAQFGINESVSLLQSRDATSEL